MKPFLTLALIAFFSTSTFAANADLASTQESTALRIHCVTQSDELYRPQSGYWAVQVPVLDGTIRAQDVWLELIKIDKVLEKVHSKTKPATRLGLLTGWWRLSFKEVTSLAELSSPKACVTISITAPSSQTPATVPQAPTTRFTSDYQPLD